MKTLAAKAVVLSALGLILFAAAPASAQSETMWFNVPFAFVAGDEVLPSGSYIVQVTDVFHLRLRSTKDSTLHFVSISPSFFSRKASDAQPGVLRFEKYGDRYVLRAVWRSSQLDGLEVKKSRTEMEWAREHPDVVPTTIDAETR